IFSTALGIHYDSNKNAAPKSGRISLLNTIISSSEKEKDDTGVLFSATLEARHDLGLQRAHELYGKINITTDQQAAQDDLDLIVGRIDLGGVIISDVGSFDISLNHNRINMAKRSYLMENGTKLRWDGIGGKKYRPYIEQKAQNQIYSTSTNKSAGEKNGWNMETKVGTKITFSPISLLDIYAMAGRKNADKSYNTFNKKGAGAAYTRLFDKGRFLIFQGSYQIDKYEDNDAFVSSVKRRDRKTSLRATGGLPLVSIFSQDTLSQQLHDVQLTGTVERSMSGSNIVNFETINNRAQIMLSKTIRF
ncbi:MAG: surface lipoprotein assembly modifier, partial [Rhodospirillaceae bacterium]|nr:surface lipoprotein assembly modifier [Rhodospirillaceae bacterium]